MAADDDAALRRNFVHADNAIYRAICRLAYRYTRGSLSGFPPRLVLFMCLFDRHLVGGSESGPAFFSLFLQMRSVPFVDPCAGPHGGAGNPFRLRNPMPSLCVRLTQGDVVIAAIFDLLVVVTLLLAALVVAIPFVLWP